jgi:hypothetical protein
MAVKVISAELAQELDSTTTEPKYLDNSKAQKKLRRAQALQEFPHLGVCMLCGDQATHRHSKSGHDRPVSSSDNVAVCANCHFLIHHGDKARQGASWAWRNPA